MIRFSNFKELYLEIEDANSKIAHSTRQEVT